MIERYVSADSGLVSLRDDWESSENTVPSKTYEVLAVGRRATDRGRLVRNGDSRQWVKTHAESEQLAGRYIELTSELLGQRSESAQ